jgi:O-antigen ligase
MILPPSFDGSFKRLVDLSVIAYLPFAFILTMLAPQALTWFCIIMAAFLVAVMALDANPTSLQQTLQPLRSLILMLLLFIGWTVARSIWSPNAASALSNVAAFVLSMLSTFLAIVVRFRIVPWPTLSLHHFPIINMVVAAALVIVLVCVAQPWFSISVGGRLSHSYHYNRAALFVALLYPLSVFAITQSRTTHAKRWCLHVGTGFMVACAVFWSDSESAKMALVVMCIVQLLSRANAVWTNRLLASAVCIALFGAPVLEGVLFDLFKSAGLLEFQAGTFAARFTIWEQAAGLVRQAPIIGNGVETMRVQAFVDTTGQVLKPAHHPHSFLLQTWVDLGLIGVLLMAGCILSVFQLIGRVGGQAGQMFMTLASGILTIWAVSHGMWQAWYVGLSGIIVAFAMHAWRTSLQGHHDT